MNRKDAPATPPALVPAVRNGFLLSLRAADDTTLESVSLAANDTVLVRNFSTPLAPASRPAPGDASQADNAQNWVRWVRLTASRAELMHIREILVLDASGYNAIRGKPCAAPLGFRTTPLPQGCDKAVDHVIDGDGLSEVFDLMHVKTAAVGAFVEWDL